MPLRPAPARSLEVGGHAIGEYFICEVLEQQPPEVARFMLDTSVLGELTAGACIAVTGRQDAAALLRSIDAASLFLVALDDERTAFRHHQLVRQVLRAELRARDRGREQVLQLRAAEWFEAGDAPWRVTGSARSGPQVLTCDRSAAIARARVPRARGPADAGHLAATCDKGIPEASVPAPEAKPESRRD